MLWILRSLGVANAAVSERRATLWTAAMFGFAMASTFVLRPIRDQFGVAQGVERMPYLYGLTLLFTVVVVPLFWWLANRMPSRRFVPIAIQSMAGFMLLLSAGFLVVGQYEWDQPGAVLVGESFWGLFSALNVTLPAVVWIHAVEFFRREQGLRLFGLVGVGGTLGAMLGSMLQLAVREYPPAVAALVALLLLQGMFLCYLRSRAACEEMFDEGDPSAGSHDRITVARGGLLEGLRLLRRDRYLWAIAAYMAMLGMVGTAFYVAQTDLVGHIERPQDQTGWFAEVDLLGQGTVLVVQLFFTGRLLQRLPPWLFLTLMPVLSIVGLGTLSIWPVVSVLGAIQILRRGANYSLQKPSREVLYTPMSLATKHKTKILLDTCVFRAGDLLGAWLQVALWTGEGGARAALMGTIGLAVVWGVLGVGIGLRSTRTVPPPGAQSGGLPTS